MLRTMRSPAFCRPRMRPPPNWAAGTVTHSSATRIACGADCQGIAKGFRRTRAATEVSLQLLVDDVQDGAARRPDEQLAEVVLGGIGVDFDGFVECDAVNAEIVVSRGDRARYLESGCRVRVFLAIARIQRSGSGVSWIEPPHIRPVVGRAVVCRGLHVDSLLVAYRP